ncbi:hypothetical protein DM860_013576 [Cuscuta australis]|uniref:Poly(A) RNA polymerase mitochondrial-like central palm domain-containing protein n=1 Tax=Cuscuta australis TaxID=267555 RepID=A0A328EB38_9ASTE|nr:hypothetical protein DM860_013576 [Cuscuta australis]
MLSMDVKSPLEQTLQYVLRKINPSKDDWSFRVQIIEELRAIVQPIDSLRGATVEPFGSFVSDLFTRHGDLDISIEMANGSYIASLGKKQKQSLLQDVLNVMRNKGGYRKIKFITGARVPILKFQGKYDISCDISINNLRGQMKSKLLYWISTIDERFRGMVLLVKEWAKAHNINDSRNGTLNSYSLSLLVIFHFQTCEPAILPPLREIYPGNMADDLTGVRVTAEKYIEDTCERNINQYKFDRYRTRNRSSLSDLFISFLAKFCDISGKASEQGVSTYTGQWEDIQGNMRWLPKTYSLFIEDPFEQPTNTARSVSSRQLANISEAFQATYNMLTSPNQDPNLLMSNFMRPSMPNFVAGAPPPRNHIIHHTRNLVGDQQRTTGPVLPIPPLTRPHVPNCVWGRPSRSGTPEQQRTPNLVMYTHGRPHKTNFVPRRPKNGTRERLMSLNSFANTSATPQKTNFVEEKLSRNQGNNSGNGIAGMHSQRAIQLSLPHQFQDMRIDVLHPDNVVHRPSRDPPAQLQATIHRPAQDWSRQSQPVWRLKHDNKVNC